MIPGYQTLMLPVLRLAEQGVEAVPDYIPHITKQFGLTQEEVEEALPSGRMRVINNRLHWARYYLYRAGLLEPVRRGHYRLSTTGRALLATNPPHVDTDTLLDYPSFVEFRQRSGGAKSGGSPGETVESTAEGMASAPAVADTPEQAIERAYAEIENALAGDLLSALTSMDPTNFEQVIVDLLLAMGYGGGERGKGVRLGKSGDGGIDGVINEDALGLDAVYVQAKRYGAGQTVGRPALQAFVGSLTGEAATKGVFVTTADFTREAHAYLNKVQHRIVLINGEMLARMMIRYGVGVRVETRIEIKTLDEGYFARA